MFRERWVAKMVRGRRVAEIARGIGGYDVKKTLRLRCQERWMAKIAREMGG